MSDSETTNKVKLQSGIYDYVSVDISDETNAGTARCTQYLCPVGTCLPVSLINKKCFRCFKHILINSDINPKLACQNLYIILTSEQFKIVIS